MAGYRAAFIRLPDNAGFEAYRDALREAQCQGATQVNSTAMTFVNTLFNSAEYNNRNPNQQQNQRRFVSDIYDVFFQRAPDVSGFNFWSGELEAGRWTRQGVINYFFGSQEWIARRNEIAAEPCIP